MEIGIVAGKLGILKAAPELAEKRMLMIKTPQCVFAALDLAGAQSGDRVLVSRQARLMDCPVDTAVIAVVDTPESK